MDRVKGKVVIVTGAASGVGREDALLLAREGARVALTDINEDGGQAVAREIGDSAMFLHHDISSEEDWRRVMAAARDRFDRLDALVNNAAILVMGSIEDTALEDWRKVHRINADGYFLGCKYAVAGMNHSGGGSIVNMSSVAALTGLPMVCAYGGAKASVTALTRSVAVYCKQWLQDPLQLDSPGRHPDPNDTQIPWATMWPGCASRTTRHRGSAIRRTWRTSCYFSCRTSRGSSMALNCVSTMLK